MNITDLIPFGSEKAISRRKLALHCFFNDLTDVISDREMRKLIQKARKEGTVILYNTSGGYYQPTNNDLQQVRRYVKTEQARALTILSEVKHAKVLLADMEAALTVGESDTNGRLDLLT